MLHNANDAKYYIVTDSVKVGEREQGRERKKESEREMHRQTSAPKSNKPKLKMWN